MAVPDIAYRYLASCCVRYIAPGHSYIASGHRVGTECPMCVPRTATEYGSTPVADASTGHGNLAYTSTGHSIGRGPRTLSIADASTGHDIGGSLPTIHREITEKKPHFQCELGLAVCAIQVSVPARALSTRILSAGCRMPDSWIPEVSTGDLVGAA
eukprot:1555991-Rhodomonas_salina.1